MMKRLPNRKLLLINLLAAIATIAVLSAMKVWWDAERKQAAALPVLGAAPDFELLERSGRTVRLADLHGKVWVADFVFTHCAGPCPLLSSRMAALQRSFAGAEDIRFVSFTVDPDRDTPEVLAEYANRFGADPDKWLFLTGEKATLYGLIMKGFKLGVHDGVTHDGMPATGAITHSVRFVLVDRDGRIRGYYDGAEAELLEKIRPDIEWLLATKAAS